MDPLRALAEGVGYFTTAQAREAGYGDRDIARMVRGRVWHRFRRGYFSFSDLWTALDEVGRHHVRSHAVLNSLGHAVALSHVSGAITHGIATWDVPLDRVHVTRLDGGAGRIERDVVHHEGVCRPEEVQLIDGLPVLNASRCVLEAASRTSAEAALVMFDSALHIGVSDHDRLMRQYVTMQQWPYVRHLHIPVRMADGRAESPGESRARWLFRSHRLPAPELQFAVFDADGVLRGTSDWGWPEQRLLGEFDGLAKYGRLLKPGQDPADVIFAEKFREDELREITSFAMVRLTWSDLARPKTTAQRIQALMRRTA